MKNIITVFAVIAITLLACTKQASNQLAPQKMTFEQLSKELGSTAIAFTIFDNAGKTEINPMARGKKVKADATVNVWLNDLTLTESGGILTTTISPDAAWGGVQKWLTVDTTNNAVSLCNWNWSYSAAPATQDCNGAVPGFQYRSWSSDKVTYDVHVSAFLPL